MNLERLYRVAGTSWEAITPEQAFIKACTMPGRVVIKDANDHSYFIASKGHTFDEEKHTKYESRQFLQMLWDNPSVDGEVELKTRANFGPCCDINMKITITYQRIRDIIEELSK